MLTTSASAALGRSSHMCMAGACWHMRARRHVCNGCYVLQAGRRPSGNEAAAFVLVAPSGVSRALHAELDERSGSCCFRAHVALAEVRLLRHGPCHALTRTMHLATSSAWRAVSSTGTPGPVAQGCFTLLGKPA